MPKVIQYGGTEFGFRRLVLDKYLNNASSMEDVIKVLNNSFDVVSGIAPIAYWYEHLNDKGRVTQIYFSDRMREMLGYKSTEDFPNSLENFRNCVHPDDVERVFDEAISAGTGKIDKFESQYRIKKADGDYLWCNAAGKVIKDKNGKNIGMYGSFIDISDRIELQKKTKEDNDKLIESLLINFNLVYRVNLSDASFSLLKIDKGIVGEGMVFADFKEARAFFINEVAYEADREMLSSEMDFDSIRKRLEVESSFSLEYRAVIQGVAIWHEMVISSLGGNEVAIGFAIKDAEVLNHHISQVLLNNYDALYVVNLNTDQMKVLKASGIMMNKPTVVTYSRMIKEFAEGLSGEAREYFERAADLNYEKDVLSNDGKTEYYYQTPYYGGTPVWLKSEVHVLTWKDNVPETAVIGITRADSLQREKIELNKQLSEALNTVTEEKNRFAVAADLINSANWSFKLDENDEVIDAEFYGEPIKILGIDLEISPHAWETILHPDDKENALKAFNATIKDHSGQTPYDITYRMKNKDGVYNWFRSAGRVLVHSDGSREFFGVQININERVEAQERQLRETEESRMLIESVSSIYTLAFTVDMKNGNLKVLRMEDDFKKHFKVTGFANYEEALKPLFTVLHPSDVEMMRNELSFKNIRKKLKDAVAYNVEYRVITENATIWHEMNITKISDNEIAMGFGENDIEITKRHLEEKRFSEYFSLYEVDIERNTAKIVKDSPYYGIAKEGTCVSFSEAMIKFANGLSGEAKEFFLHRVNPKNAQIDLAEDGRHTFTYQSPNVDGKWIDCTSYVTHRNSDGTPSMFTLGFSYIDSHGAARQELRNKISVQNEKLEEQQKQLQLALETAKTESIKNELIIGAIRAGKWTYIISPEDEVKKAIYSKEILSLSGNKKSRAPMAWLDYVHPDDKERVIKEFNGAISDHSGKTAYDTTFRIYSNDGLIRWTRSAGRVIRHPDGNGEFFGINMDLTDQIVALDLANQQRHIKAFGDMVNAALWNFELDSENNVSKVIWSNEFRRMLGFDENEEDFPDEIEVWAKRIHPEDRERVIKHLYDAMKREVSDKFAYDVQYRILRKNKKYCWYHAVGRTEYNEVGVKIMYGIIFDISANKKLEEQLVLSDNLSTKLKQAFDEAQSANKAKTEFLFNMSHDIRTPMNAILGFTNMAEKHIDDKARVIDCLEKTKQSGNLLLSLINGVLDMSRIEHGSKKIEEKEGDVLLSFANIETTLREAAAIKDIELNFKFGEISDRFVYADFDRCLRIFTNLISNAIKYTQAGGTVNVSCEQISPKEGEYAKYRYIVEDNGMGMSEEFQQHMYESFSREHNTTTSGIQGTGLGLSVCKTFVDYLGGTIDCESNLGKGTKFTIVLPFRVQDREQYTDPVTGEVCVASTQTERQFKEVSFVGKKLLLVDDNEMNREIVINVLEDQKMVIEEADNGESAVKLVKKKGPNYYDYILMDIQMPIMNGYEATKRIRDLYPKKHIPIIALSANAFSEDKAASIEAGMDDHVAKPIMIKELFSVLSRF